MLRAPGPSYRNALRRTTLMGDLPTVGTTLRIASFLVAEFVLLLAFAPVALAQSPVAGSTPSTLYGKSAFGDWRMDAPLVRRKITIADLPRPYATWSAYNF